MGNSRIVRLVSENVKRLKAVDVTLPPGTDMVRVAGRNGQGKSSLLDSIEYALAGKGAIPAKPIREGQSQARVVVETDDLIITRTFTPTDTYLSVATRDGRKVSGPQQILDKLTGALTFDPLAFLRMKAAEQVETLKRLAGLDFTEHDRVIKDAYEDRRLHNREVKQLEARLMQSPPVNAPDTEISIRELTQDYQAAVKRKQENDAVRRSVSLKEAFIEEVAAIIADLERQIEVRKQEMRDAKAALELLRETVAGVVDPDIDGLRQEMEQAESVNHLVRQKREHDQIVRDLADARRASDACTRKIEEAEQAKRDAIAGAAMPLDGLSFDDAGVTLEGMPVDQLSQAQKIRLGVAIGFAMHPVLRVMLVRDASLLDEDSMFLLGQLAHEYDAQIWVERVSDGNDVSVVIEDGSVTHNPYQKEAPATPATANN